MRKELKRSYQDWPPRKGISHERIPHYCKKADEWRCMINGIDGKYEERSGLYFVMSEFSYLFSSSVNM